MKPFPSDHDEPERDRAESPTDAPLSISICPRAGAASADSTAGGPGPGIPGSGTPGSGIEVRIHGALVVNSAWQVKELELADLGRLASDSDLPIMAGSITHIELDLSDVTKLDAAGVAAVVFLARSAQADGYQVHIVEPAAQQARTLVEMTGMFDLLNRRSVLAA